MPTTKRPVEPAAHPTDDEFPGYRPVSNFAVAGFLFGLASVLLFISLKFAFVPVLGLLFSGLALRRIAVLENLVAGRRLALAGLTLSLSCGLMTVTRDVLLYRQMRSEARRFAMQWFSALEQRQPYLAHQLQSRPAARLQLDTLAQRYAVPPMRQAIEGFVAEPLNQALLNLGERAQVRYFQHLELTDKAGQRGVVDIYAVTVDRDGERTTFFVDLVLERTRQIDRTWAWQVHSAKLRTTPPPALNRAGR